MSRSVKVSALLHMKKGALHRPLERATVCDAIEGKGPSMHDDLVYGNVPGCAQLPTSPKLTYLEFLQHSKCLGLCLGLTASSQAPASSSEPNGVYFIPKPEARDAKATGVGERVLQNRETGAGGQAMATARALVLSHSVLKPSLHSLVFETCERYSLCPLLDVRTHARVEGARLTFSYSMTKVANFSARKTQILD